MPSQGYVRYPTIHQDQIVFISEDDLWLVLSEGGRAERLTAGVAEVSYPRFSPDGTTIAWVRREESPGEVYLMPPPGAHAQRLTFQDASCRISGWSTDGDIFSHSFKLMGLGPLIGKRTWGGVIGISPRYTLVDGTRTTQPENAFWFKDVGWNVESYGTDPDIEVDIAPQDYVNNIDPQLERAIAEAMSLIEEVPVLEPKPEERPRKSRA